MIVQDYEEGLPSGGLETALQAWNQVYETVWPHQTLDYKTPDQFYQSLPKGLAQDKRLNKGGIVRHVLTLYTG